MTVETKTGQLLAHPKLLCPAC